MANRPLADVCARCDWTGAPEHRPACPSCGSPVRIGDRITPGALSHDFGGRERYHRSLPVYTERMAGNTTSRTACHWPARWRPIAVEILDMPVPVRDEPGAVSGEVGRG